MQTLSNRHVELLEARGIEGETAARLGWRSKDKMLAIPYLQAGKEVGVKYRTLEGDKRFFQEKGSSQIFYNWDVLADPTSETIVITEGEMDCAIALQCGFMAVSVPNGAPMTAVENGDKKYDYLKSLPPEKTIILAVDADDAGANLLHDLSLRIGQHRCKWVKYPEGCKDLNETFLHGGAKAVVEALNNAQWTKIDGLYRLDELPEPPMQEAYACPVDGLQDLYKLRGGDLTVITGIPGYGKTSLVNHIAGGMALRHGWNVAIASFEQNPRIDHRRALRTFYHSKPQREMTLPEKQSADDWIKNKFTFLVPGADDMTTLAWVIEKATAAILRNHCKLIVIDPWNEMDHDYFDSQMSLTQYTGFAIKRLKKLAAQYLVHIIVVAHPAKLRRLNSGDYPIPGLYDISDSAHFINKPDMGIVIHRNEDGSMLFRVQKCRYIGTIGKIGEAILSYDRDRNILRSIPQPF